MPFDPTIPAPHADLTSQMFRDQFNGLKALIDDLQTQINALQPPASYTAAGFAEAGVNGALVDQGTFGAEHYYRTPGGYYFIFSAGDNLWVVTNAPPGQSSPFFYTKPPGSITGNWNVGTGPAPAGTVS